MLHENNQKFKDVLLMQGLLHNICELSESYIFQQDSIPAHWVRETVELLTNSTPDIIPLTLWPPDSPDLNPVDYEIWSVMQEKVYRSRIDDVDELCECMKAAWE